MKQSRRRVFSVTMAIIGDFTLKNKNDTFTCLNGLNMVRSISDDLKAIYLKFNGYR